MKPVTIEGMGVFLCANRAAKLIGSPPNAVDRQFCRSKTWYGYAIRTVKRGKHWLADERDVNVMAIVKREISVPVGAVSHDQRERMKAFALELRAKLYPAP